MPTSSPIDPISDIFILHTIRTCCNGNKNPWPHWLFLQISHSDHDAYITTTSGISNRFAGQRSGLCEIMRISGDVIPPHWHDQIAKCLVSCFIFVCISSIPKFDKEMTEKYFLIDQKIHGNADIGLCMVRAGLCDVPNEHHCIFSTA